MEGIPKCPHCGQREKFYLIRSLTGGQGFAEDTMQPIAPKPVGIGITHFEFAQVRWSGTCCVCRECGVMFWRFD